MQHIGSAELHFHLWGIAAKGRMVLQVKGQILFSWVRRTQTHTHKTEVVCVWGGGFKVQSKKMKIWVKNCVELSRS